MSQTETYSTPAAIFFWLLWIVSLLVLLLFGFFLLASADSPVLASWNGLIVLAEGFLLFITARHFVRKDMPISQLLLWIAGAALGVPLLAFGGCMLLEQMNYGFKLGH